MEDVPALAELHRAHREFMAPWEPVRDDSYFTVDGQRAVIGTALQQHERGFTHPRVIVEEGRILGRITLNSIERGPCQWCSLGYWVNPADNGRGVATAAVRDMIGVAFDELRLHRIQAGTLLHNLASQRVLARNGFVRYGVAPKYLKIAGEWQDHALHQLLTTTPM